MSNTIAIDPQEEITCPRCDKQFPLQEGLTHQLIEELESAQTALLESERQALTEKITGQLEKQMGQQAEEKQAALVAELTALREQLDKRDEQLDNFRKNELELRQQKRDLEDKQKDLDLELERRLEAQTKQIEGRLSEAFAERYSEREQQLLKKIDDAQRANDELNRKLQQGSQQLQGETLELEIEETLAQAFPLDVIEEVKKGARGADIVQTVQTRSGANCGKIVWESKRAENWSNKWIPKLKEDMQLVTGDIAVLVSTVFPAGIEESMLIHEDVWLVKPHLVKGLSEALRQALIESHRQKAISAGRGEQMEALFDYICSNQFAQRIRAVVEGYQEMRSDLDKEMAAMQRIWKKRSSQIDKVSSQVVSICGELQGISSNSLPQLDSVASLEELG